MANQAQPVIEVALTDLRIGGGARLLRNQAIQVRCAQDGAPLRGGPALPVYVLSENDIRDLGGGWIVTDLASAKNLLREFVPFTMAVLFWVVPEVRNTQLGD